MGWLLVGSLAIGCGGDDGDGGTGSRFDDVAAPPTTMVPAPGTAGTGAVTPAPAPGSVPGAVANPGVMTPGMTPPPGSEPATPGPPEQAKGLTLTELSIYQTLRIGVMKDGQPEPPSAIPLIAAKDTMLRVYVLPDETWVQRAVIARAEISAGGMELEPVEAMAFINKPSTEEALNSTINIEIPRDRFPLGASIAVGLFEQDGTPVLDLSDQPIRWPAVDRHPLALKDPGGPFKLKVVPFRWNGDGSGRVPMINPQEWEDLLFAMYPINLVELEVAEPVDYNPAWALGEAVNGVFLEGLCSMRAAQETDPLRHWYGVVEDTELPGGGAQGISRLPGPLDSNGRCSVGRGYGIFGSGTAMHELGHAMGRGHAPCGVIDVDPLYPYPEAATNTWGYLRVGGLLMPPDSKDLMSYCGFPPHISDYNYNAVFERLSSYYPATAVRAYRIPEELVYDSIVVLADGTVHVMDPVTLGERPMNPLVTVELVDGGGHAIGEVGAHRWDTSHGESVAWWIPRDREVAAGVRLPGVLGVVEL